ncbi:MAG: hypothetical protein ACTSUE_16935 [Promethearchaeota archaeon]
MSEESKHGDNCECDKPEILDHFKGRCSPEQIVKCHGHVALENHGKEGTN